MPPVLFAVFLLLMLAGNVFAACQLFTDGQGFLTRFPRMSASVFSVFRLLPLVNAVAMAGLWFNQAWAAWLSIVCGLAVLALDIYFDIGYHLYVAVPSLVILLFFLVRYWNHFK